MTNKATKKRIHFIFILSIFLPFLFDSCSLPKANLSNWEGKLVYQLRFSRKNDKNLIDSTRTQTVYIKDSLLRIENRTAIGEQVYLKNLDNNQTYILMTIDDINVAVDMNVDSSHHKKNAPKEYILKNKLGHKKIAGRKMNNILVTNQFLDTTMVMNYDPDISAKYSTAFKNFPGLPSNYSIYSKGTWINYTIQKIIPKEISNKKFTIPKGYRIITLKEFIQMMRF